MTDNIINLEADVTFPGDNGVNSFFPTSVVCTQPYRKIELKKKGIIKGDRVVILARATTQHFYLEGSRVAVRRAGRAPNRASFIVFHLVPPSCCIIDIFHPLSLFLTSNNND